MFSVSDTTAFITHMIYSCLGRLYSSKLSHWVQLCKTRVFPHIKQQSKVECEMSIWHLIILGVHCLDVPVWFEPKLLRMYIIYLYTNVQQDSRLLHLDFIKIMQVGGQPEMLKNICSDHVTNEHVHVGNMQCQIYIAC